VVAPSSFYNVSAKIWRSASLLEMYRHYVIIIIIILCRLVFGDVRFEWLRDFSQFLREISGIFLN
jgi:hypothetical protein